MAVHPRHDVGQGCIVRILIHNAHVLHADINLSAPIAFRYHRQLQPIHTPLH